MDKIDFKKKLPQFYRPSQKTIELVDVPEMNFLMIDGKGDPNTSSEFKAAAEALFSLSYTLKFMIKKGPTEIDYGVLPLEGLWWADDMSSFSVKEKDKWFWTLMMMQPEFITADLVQVAMARVQKKKELSALSRVRFEAFSEGQSAQTLHIGPFSEEGPTIERVHQFIDEKGMQKSGKHHEIYLSDVRRAAPEKWRTVIRQPAKQTHLPNNG